MYINDFFYFLKIILTSTHQNNSKYINYIKFFKKTLKFLRTKPSLKE